MMLKSLFVTAALAAVAAGPVASEEPAAASATADSPAMAEAKANRARMATSPSVKRGDDEPAYPAREKALGNGGEVMVKGIVDVNGRFVEGFVLRSEVGPALEAAALADVAGTDFYSARDEAGAPIAVVIAVPVRFSFRPDRPATVTKVEAVYSDADREAGRSGSVTVGGFVQGDGHMRDARVLVSSLSPELDAAAVTAATSTVYKAPEAGAGDTPLRLSYDFVNYRSPGKGGGILRYRCGQFAKDQTWWRATWPEKERGEIYTMMFGAGSMMMMSSFAADPKALKVYVQDFEARWVKAIATCQAKPDALFIDVFKPEGQYARALAERAS